MKESIIQFTMNDKNECVDHSLPNVSQVELISMLMNVILKCKEMSNTMVDTMDQE